MKWPYVCKHMFIGALATSHGHITLVVIDGRDVTVVIDAVRGLISRIAWGDITD